MIEEAQRLAQAASWRIRLAESRSESCEEFETWLAADPGNVTAWLKAQHPWKILGDHATLPQVVGLRRAALTHANSAAAGWRSRTGAKLRWPTRLGLAAAAVVLAAGSWALWQSYHFDVYRTRAGERRMETLSDGSEITLDSNSEVRVRYTRHSRELVLVGGQALFNVAHDAVRPFSVAAHQHEIVATGTSFNVDLLGPQLTVTLLEGHVVVVPREGDKEDTTPGVQRNGPAAEATTRIDLDAGERLVLAPSDVASITHVNVDHAVAWEKGRLVFEDEPLASVVRRVGRYSAHPIVIADEAIANLRISGVFHEGDVEGFVSTVVSYLPVQAGRGSDGSIQLRAAAPSQDP
jgi:transmembrane sensor